MTQSVYVLCGGKNGNAIRGTYSSLDQLKIGTDYWIKCYPQQTLAYEEWQMDMPEEPISWEWCYINPNDTESNLESGGGTVPPRIFWGQNIIGVEWYKL